MSQAKYRLKEKLKRFLLVYAVICILFYASYTFSRYIDTTSSIYEIGIANFNVKVNEIEVIEGKEFKLVLSPNANTSNNKIVPNSKGYFEIVIDPTGTEVALEYEFKFNLENLDEDIKLVKCVLNDQDTQNLEIINNSIKGDILLSNTNHGFNQNDKLNIKIYWEWNDEEDIINPTISNTNIMVTSVVRQKID